MFHAEAAATKVAAAFRFALKYVYYLYAAHSRYIATRRFLRCFLCHGCGNTLVELCFSTGAGSGSTFEAAGANWLH